MRGAPCAICGQTHDRIGALVMPSPDPWLALSEEQRLGGLCDSDLCRTPAGETFVFAVLEAPLVGGPQPVVEFGVWAQLGEDDFRRYYETYSDLDQAKIGPLASVLANEIAGFAGSFGLKATVLPQDHGERPLLKLEPGDHPLAVAQREGMPMRKVLQIIHGEDAA
jgi:hypothetical protein